MKRFTHYLLSYLTATIGFVLTILLAVGVVFEFFDDYVVGESVVRPRGSGLAAFVFGAFGCFVVWILSMSILVEKGEDIDLISDEKPSHVIVEWAAILTAIVVLFLAFYYDWDKYLSIRYYVR
ncbi:MAG: hypothetical protein JXA92_05365 [candidate division Zixibacteria bacterium]|nr:hypothetical protein [candidate division Zixibacteria bacterium]